MHFSVIYRGRETKNRSPQWVSLAFRPETFTEANVLYTLWRMWPVVLFMTVPFWIGFANKILSAAF